MDAPLCVYVGVCVCKAGLYNWGEEEGGYLKHLTLIHFGFTVQPNHSEPDGLFWIVLCY